MDPAVVGYACSVAIFAALRYLFCTSSLRGIWASSSLWEQVVETDKARQLKLCEYLKHPLKEIPKHIDDTSLTFLDDPFPWSEECRKQKNTTTGAPDFCRSPINFESRYLWLRVY